MIRERLAPLHPHAQVIGVPVGVPSDLPPHANILLLRRSMCVATSPRHPATGLALRRTVGAPGVVGYRLLSSVAVQRPTRDHFRGSADNLAEFALAAIFAASSICRISG